MFNPIRPKKATAATTHARDSDGYCLFLFHFYFAAASSLLM